MLNVMATTQILPTGFTDHYLVSMGFNLPLASGGSSYWSLNTHLLNDMKFKDAFQAVWERIRSSKFEHANLRLWWDLAKGQVKSFCQQYSLYATKLQNLSIDSLKAEIAALEENINTAGKDTIGDRLLWTKKAILAELVRQ